MSKPKSIEITIPLPCSENRDEMTLTTDGRFCTHGQKTVIDFSTWSDTALYNFFSKNTERVCGTFSADQLNRPIYIPYQPHSRLYRITIALGLTLIFSQTPNLLAQNRPPKTEQTSILKQARIGDIGTHIGGRVLSDKKEVLPGVIVHALQGTIIVGSAITDPDGNYKIGPLEPGVYNITFEHDGYNETKITDVIVAAGQRTTQNVTLKRVVANELSAVNIVAYRKPLVDGMPIQSHFIKNYQTSDSEQAYQTAPSHIIPPHPENIEPISDSIINKLQQQTQNNKQTEKLDIDNPTKRTFTRDEISHMPE